LILSIFKTTMLASFILFFSFLSSVAANCDNNCSGHGTCMTDDVCNCYDNWGSGLSHDSGDCSDRVCPYELAWVDTPDRSGRFHKYAECAGRGICNRESGECQCFDGYEGKGCQRTTCPNDCSGHGTCEFIDDMAIEENWLAYAKTENSYKTFAYNNWDSRKVRGCVCDAHYGDIDCSKRMCPYATDVLDVRDSDLLLVDQKYQVQRLSFRASDGTNTALNGKTFALTFRSKLNETFTTIPIVFNRDQPADFVNDIQLALLNLPNRVIDGVAVSMSTDQAVGTTTVSVTFNGEGVQGPQHPLVVEDYECGSGCTPKITGLDLETRYGRNYYSNHTEVVNADFNSYECGRRGKCDYTSGLCQCFTGYTGCACQVLTTLS
jgi:hypothetical protein